MHLNKFLRLYKQILENQNTYILEKKGRQVGNRNHYNSTAYSSRYRVYLLIE